MKLQLPPEQLALLLYRQVYRLTDAVTPLPVDCGQLCSGTCCRGGENDGMLLFPYEAQLLSNEPWLHLSRRKMGARDVDFAVCTGRCRRALRPLSCRLYPFAPVLSDGMLRLEPDPRARYFCPLLEPGAAPYLREDFLPVLTNALEFLRVLPGFSSFLTDYARMLDEYRRFTEPTDRKGAGDQ